MFTAFEHLGSPGGPEYIVYVGCEDTGCATRGRRDAYFVVGCIQADETYLRYNGTPWRR